VSRLWTSAGIDRIGTGYALLEGLWRQHSWGVDADGAVIETKMLSQTYVGLTLPAGESTVKFVLNNYEGDVEALLRGRTARATEMVRVLRAVHARAARGSGEAR
jgi:hypothetical protein